MSEDRTNVDNYDEMVFLLFNIFIFIYRNHNCVGDPKTRSFVNIFLKLIKNRDKHEAFPIEELLDSINICLSYDVNKVLFINENGIPNLYIYFDISSTKTSVQFWKICHKVYKLDQRDYLIK
ncbi:hypothetical protein RF11_07457 [Thelohanellus kitauei]|uniref:Uncharacterized protein n=1 Tax=Thelohanellus kitauei TaxID=669202 RepID=A0A0C2MTC1_THEKT|nr:hypothetical protein RF11_07457 [Thelohanellus kitauei]